MMDKTISHYKILEKLGGGGMGVVYKAEDTKLKRTVALKFLPPDLTRDNDAKARFINEAQTASALDHPNICTIYEIDETEDGRMFIAMAYYEGETLKKKVTSNQLSVNSVMDIAIQIAQGLAMAHQHGIVHRDIKPANVIVTIDGVVKIIDFGLAKLTGAKGITKSPAAMGTMAYMSPEQLRGEIVDHRSDIWSLGVALYEMAAGQLPFREEHELALVYSIMNEKPAPITALRPDLPGELQQIVEKAMQDDRDKRYQRLDEMLGDLKLLKNELDSASAERRPATAASRKRKRSYFYGSIAGLLVLLLGISLAIRQFRELRKATISSDQYRIAVLPLVNISPNEKDEYFADGMTEELISTLSRISRFRVIARTSVMCYLNFAPKLFFESAFCKRQQVRMGVPLRCEV